MAHLVSTIPPEHPQYQSWSRSLLTIVCRILVADDMVSNIVRPDPIPGRERPNSGPRTGCNEPERGGFVDDFQAKRITKEMESILGLSEQSRSIAMQSCRGFNTDGQSAYEVETHGMVRSSPDVAGAALGSM